MALRLGVGAHFYMEGSDKIRGEEAFSSAGFLGIAKGPLAPVFHGMVWDRDGLARLNYARGSDGTPGINLDGVLNRWALYRERVIAYYEFDEAQKKSAEAVEAAYERQLRWFFATNAEEIKKYFRGLERRSEAEGDPAYREVESLRGQAATWTGEMMADRGPWLAAVDSLWRGYERDLTAIARPEQRGLRTPRLGRPGRRPLDSLLIDQIVPWFDLAVGVLLILGLFTRIASLAGAVFLASIVATQWPGAPGAASTVYQIVEMLALLVLAAVGAGRFAGLDYILRYAWTRRRFAKKGAPHESDA